MKQCSACGMPLVNKEDFAKGDENSEFCAYCVNDDGSVKTCEEIFNGGVAYFLHALGGEKTMAEKITRKNMKALAYWQSSDCDLLKGEMATDEEFIEAIKKL